MSELAEADLGWMGLCEGEIFNRRMIVTRYLCISWSDTLVSGLEVLLGYENTLTSYIYEI